jgi:hypothetical protein
MTTANVNKFNKFVLSFLKDTSQSENINELWMSPDVQKQVKHLSASGGNGRKKKDPDAPRRGKSGYLFFCSDHRDAVKASLGESSKATDVTKELGVRWNALKDSKKPADKKILAAYEKAAADDKARYQSEKSEYTPPESNDDENTRRGKGKSPKKGPKRAKSGYLYFCEDRRNKLKSENPNLKSTEITSELGRLWNELKSDESRSAELAIYEKQATDDKNRYDAEKVDDQKTSSKKNTSKKDTSKKDSSKKDSSKKDSSKKEAPKKGKKAAQVDDVDVEDEEVTKSGKNKEPSVKKVNGYQKFCETRRPELKASYSNEKPADITKRMANEWKSLSKDEQTKWS